MKKFTMIACLVMALMFALAASATDIPESVKGHNSTQHGGSIMSAKAGGDTINLMAAGDDPTNGPGEPLYLGDFENGEFESEWTHEDLTKKTTSHYVISDYNQDGGDLAVWAGDISLPSCNDSLDVDGGDGNSWHDWIDFTAAVRNPGISATVNITAYLQNDTEPDWDFTFLTYQYADQPTADLASWDGISSGIVASTVTYSPVEYIDGTDVRIIWRFSSDGAWSDEDCKWATAGAHQIDDITIEIVQTGQETDTYVEDFEDGDLNLGDPLDPGNNSSYLWSIAYPFGVGDFTQLWEGLEDADPCRTNYTKQVAFIDDGLIVPGTGGTDCINWCYGPGGYIVNTTGGLAGPENYVNNTITSPVMDWPNDAYDGVIYEFGIFRHEDKSVDSPGMYYYWEIRSADEDRGQTIETASWTSRGYVYWGGPDYIYAGEECTDLMEPGRDKVQVQAAVWEVGWAFNLWGNDGYPAPYLDNFKLSVFPYTGPGISTRGIDLANDNFPERGSIDFEDLGSHSVRFDAAMNISPGSHDRNDPGDSVTFDIKPVRAGSELFGDTKLFWIMQQNPVFDDYRTSHYGTAYSGDVSGVVAVGAGGVPEAGRYAFDLPDTGFLFPGDVLHYYIGAADAVDGQNIQTSILPADTVGFSTSFGDPLGYNSLYVVHALPTINEDEFGVHSTPPVLFWNDFGTRGGENEWYTAFNNAGYIVGEDYDIYMTNTPSSGQGNGLGGRALSDLNIEHYSDMLYTAGDLGGYTISNGDFAEDAGDDLGVLTSWILQGGKDLFMTGDDVASDLIINGGGASLTFAEETMGVNFELPLMQDILTYIDNQATPVVKAAAGNPVFQNISSWVAFGGCPAINKFDGVKTVGTAERLAEFTDVSGAIGAYTFSAGTLNYPTAAPTSRVVSLPYDFMYVYTDAGAKADAPLPARAQMLRDVLAWMGLPFVPGNVSSTPELVKFSARNYPNPFNPSTKIFYTMPKAGHLTLKVYNVRGQLVKTLIDGQVKAGEDHVVWDGKNNQNAGVSSGVYFYEARSENNVVVNKMALVK